MDAKRKQALDEVGRQIMSEVRDEAFSQLQLVISGRMRDQTSTKLHSEYLALDEKGREAVQRFLAVASDFCLVRALQYIDVHEIPLMVSIPGGVKVDARAASDGLVGELYSDQGWIARFSAFGDRIRPLG